MILPVFNVGKYLERCIKSIINQSLKDIQIILVNDGSTDNSLLICENYAKIDNRIKVINKPNGGVSSARNAGIEIAEGEYVGFVDPDDWIEADMYQSMYDQITKNKADVCMCNYIKVSEDGNIEIPLTMQEDVLKRDLIIKDIILEMISFSNINSKSESLMGNVWRLLIRRKLINMYSIKFSPDIPFMEDLLYCISLFSKCNRVCINRGFFYHYCIHSESASIIYRQNLSELQISVLNEIERILKQENIYIVAKERLIMRYINMFISSIVNETNKENKKNFKEKIMKINKMLKDEKLSESINEVNTEGYTLRKKIVMFSIKHRCSIYLYAYYYFVNLRWQKL